jgi:hypothetical protein
MVKDDLIGAHDRQAEAILTAATLRAAAQLGLGAATLSTIVGVSAATLRRMQTGESRFRANSKPAELAKLLVRVYVALSRVVGDAPELQRVWVASHNRAFNSAPISAMQKVEGLAMVARYLEDLPGAPAC